MKTKLQLLFVILLTAFSVSVLAQQKQKTAEEMAKGFNDKMKKTLSLSQDQVSKIEPINLDYVKKIQNLKKQYAGNKQELENKIKETNADREVKIRKIFNENQYTKYLKHLSDLECR